MVQRLRYALREMVDDYPLVTREPSNERIREWLKSEQDGLVRLLLYLTDRADHTRRIRDALLDGKWVLCDRFTPSTMVYNPVITEDWFPRLVEVTARGIVPDVTIVLDADPEVLIRRLQERGTYEPMADAEMLSIARRRYLHLAQHMGYHVVDASHGIDVVVAECLEIIRAAAERWKEG